MWRLKFLICLCLISVFDLVLNLASLKADWTMSGYDVYSTGENKTVKSSFMPPLVMRWARTDVGGSPGAHPLISDARVFIKRGFTSYYPDGNLTVVDAKTGETLWIVPGDTNFETKAPIIYKDTLVNFHSGQGKLRSYNVKTGVMTGEVSVPSYGLSASIVDSNGIVYFRTGGMAYAFNATTL